MTIMDAEIIDLQSRVAFQESHIDALNLTVNQHQQIIRQLKNQVEILQQRLDHVSEQMNFDIQNSLPPHY